MQTESSITCVSPIDKAIDNTATRKQSHAFRMIAMLLTVMPGTMVVGTLAAPDIAAAASYSCTPLALTGDGYVTATCTVYSGQIRLRNYCKGWTDKYSNWVGKGKHNLATGKCTYPLTDGGSEGRGIEARN